MKGKLGIAGSSSGSGKLNAKLLRSLTMSPGGSTWQVYKRRPSLLELYTYFTCQSEHS